MGLGPSVAVCCTVVGIQHLAGMRKQRLHRLPYPRRSIRHHTTPDFLFGNQARFLHLSERLAYLAFPLHLMPTQKVDDAVALQEVQTKALGLAPLALPPRPPCALAPWPWPTAPSAVRPQWPIGPLDPYHQHWTTQTALGPLGKAPLDRRSRGRDISHGEPLGSLGHQRMHTLTTDGNPTQLAKRRRGRVIGSRGHEVGGGLWHITVETARTQAQHLIAGIAAVATVATLAIRALQLEGANHRFNGTSNRGTSCQETLTGGTGPVCSLLFLWVGVLEDQRGSATRALLPQGPERFAHLGSSRLGLGQLGLQPIEPRVKAIMQALA